ncbi:hypothetical protein BCON_0183g00110 [Botryotinia convoluta]|uniref:Uncharacterized protein n=1 Tax=Botryotinia convoluta TaxID=54673 RepID=A0A4Z1HN14_9HELO|nr:hypothetical protein BCON_0183g00110 [Botryotinia convoluta]
MIANIQEGYLTSYNVVKNDVLSLHSHCLCSSTVAKLSAGAKSIYFDFDRLLARKRGSKFSPEARLASERDIASKCILGIPVDDPSLKVVNQRLANENASKALFSNAARAFRFWP